MSENNQSMAVMHWLRVDGLTHCGRPQRKPFNPKRDCKLCLRFMSDPKLKVAVIRK